MSTPVSGECRYLRNEYSWLVVWYGRKPSQIPENYRVLLRPEEPPEDEPPEDDPPDDDPPDDLLPPESPRGVELGGGEYDSLSLERVSEGGEYVDRSLERPSVGDVEVERSRERPSDGGGET